MPEECHDEGHGQVENKNAKYSMTYIGGWTHPNKVFKIGNDTANE